MKKEISTNLIITAIITAIIWGFFTYQGRKIAMKMEKKQTQVK